MYLNQLGPSNVSTKHVNVRTQNRGGKVGKTKETISAPTIRKEN